MLQVLDRSGHFEKKLLEVTAVGVRDVGLNGLSHRLKCFKDCIVFDLVAGWTKRRDLLRRAHGQRFEHAFANFFVNGEVDGLDRHKLLGVLAALRCSQTYYARRIIRRNQSLVVFDCCTSRVSLLRKSSHLDELILVVKGFHQLEA